MGLLLVWVVLVEVEPAQNSCTAPEHGIITALSVDGCRSSRASQRSGVKPRVTVSGHVPNNKLCASHGRSLSAKA